MAQIMKLILAVSPNIQACGCPASLQGLGNSGHIEPFLLQSGILHCQQLSEQPLSNLWQIIAVAFINATVITISITT